MLSVSMFLPHWQSQRLISGETDNLTAEENPIVKSELYSVSFKSIFYLLVRCWSFTSQSLKHKRWSVPGYSPVNTKGYWAAFLADYSLVFVIFLFNVRDNNNTEEKSSQEENLLYWNCYVALLKWQINLAGKALVVIR